MLSASIWDYFMPDPPLKEGGLAWGRRGEGAAQGESPAHIHSVPFPCELLSITLLSTTQLVKRARFFLQEPRSQKGTASTSLAVHLLKAPGSP